MFIECLDDLVRPSQKSRISLQVFPHVLKSCVTIFGDVLAIPDQEEMIFKSNLIPLSLKFKVTFMRVRRNVLSEYWNFLLP